MITCCAMQSRSEAVLVHQYTFNDGTANDSIGTAHGTLQGNASTRLGVVDLPGGIGDFVDLPGPAIDMTALVDATVEAWFTWEGGGLRQRIFDFGVTQSGQARDYFYFSPNGSGTASRAGMRDCPAAGSCPIEITLFGPAVSQEAIHHVALVVDDNANGGTDRISLYVDGEFRIDDVALYSFSQLDFNFAYLGRSLSNADAYLNGSIDEFRIHNHALSAAEVAASYAAGPTPIDLLGIEVNTLSGAVRLTNVHTSALAFDYYRVRSAAGALNAAGWNSLDDQNVDALGPGAGESWDEAGSPDANGVAELYLLGASALGADASRQLGNLFNPSVFGKRQDGDLVFQYALQGGDLRQGIVTYVTPPPLPGDYNDNGVVDAADYAVWRDHLNSNFQLPNEVAGVSPGTVTAADYDAWKLRFGDTLSGSGAAAQAAGVPEPNSAVLFLLALACHAIYRDPRGR